jgi:hypothetical protein
MTTSPRVGFTDLVAGQAVPETTVNEIGRRVEQGASYYIVKDRDLATPPGSPAQGDAYIVAGSPTGAWTGQAKSIAFYQNTAWAFIAPIEGTTAYIQDENTRVEYDGSAWGPPSTAGITLDDLDDVSTAGAADGDVLTYDSGGGNWISAPPTGGGGGGGGTWALAGTGQTATGLWDFAVDGAKANVDFGGLGSANEILIVCKGITCTSTGGVRVLRVGTGGSIHSGASDYVNIDGNGVETTTNALAIEGAGTTTAKTCAAFIQNTPSGPKYIRQINRNLEALFVANNNAIDTVRIYVNGGFSHNGGKIYCWAR